MAKKFGISTLLRNKLISDDTLNGLISNKVYPIVAPEGTEGNYVIYYRDRYSRDRTKVGIMDTADVVFAVISDDYDTSQLIAETIDNVLDGYHSGIGTVYLKDSTEDLIDKKYTQILIYSIF